MNNLSWHIDASRNFGDDLNPYLYEKIVGKAPDHIPLNKDTTKFMAIGSVISGAGNNTIVWGAGAMFANTKILSKPDIRAVRGPMTRQIAISSNVQCPEVYGDPALLLPRFYNPSIPKRYKVGFIPHYIDHNHIDVGEGCLKINIGTPIEEFIDLVISCERIVSTSLHGLIVADAYGIPSRWAEVSSKVAGNGFKFHDYFRSIRVSPSPALDLRGQEIVSASALINSVEPYNINIDLNKLMDACPFFRG